MPCHFQETRTGSSIYHRHYYFVITVNDNHILVEIKSMTHQPTSHCYREKARGGLFKGPHHTTTYYHYLPNKQIWFSIQDNLARNPKFMTDNRHDSHKIRVLICNILHAWVVLYDIPTYQIVHIKCDLNIDYNIC